MAQLHTDTKYEQLSYNEHVKKRIEMYLGSKSITENENWIIDCDNKIECKTLNYSIAMFNAILEIIVNGIDHCNRTKNIKDKCNEIKVSFKDGIIKVKNNGEGVIVEKYKDKNYYIPELIFSHEMSGSNFDDDSTKISAGTNGSGAKLCNILSKSFQIETVDNKNKKKYIQIFQNGNTVVGKPQITKASGKSYTKISFELDYDYFNVKLEDIKDLLNELLYTRLCMSSVYLNNLCNCCKFYYNDKLIKYNKLNDISKLIESDFIEAELVNKTNKKKLNVNIHITNNSSDEHIAMLNGLLVSKGTHIKYINKLIYTNLKSKIDKKFKSKINVTSKLVSNYLLIICSGDIENPKFNNQTKNELSISLTKFKDYDFDKKVYDKIWKELEKIYDILYFKKITTNDEKKIDTSGIKMYHPARLAKTKDRLKCSLFITEGDSASACVRSGIASNKELKETGMYGIYSVCGVLINAMKEVDIKQFRDKDGKKIQIIDRKKKLMDNERIKSMSDILRLNYNYSYDLTKKGDEEFSTLGYGQVVIGVDADSVTEDTVLTLLNENFQIEIKKIKDIIKNPIKIGDKYYSSSKYKVWTDKGWTNIKYVMKHKTNKKIYRVLTNNGIVYVTEDHSLLNSKAEKIRPSECNDKTRLLSKKLTKTELSYSENSHEFFYVITKFLLYGRCTDDEIFIHASESKLRKIYNAMVFEFGDIFQINDDTITFNDNMLDDEYKSFICDVLYEHIYYDKTEKYLCPYLLNLPLDILKYIAFEIVSELNYNGVLNFSMFDKSEFSDITYHTIHILLSLTGYRPSYDKFANMLIRQENKEFCIIEEVEMENITVYDLETENHHFQAGIGDLIVHNTDGHNICALILAYFQLFFPALFERRYISILLTPLIRAIPKTKSKFVEEFYNEAEFNKWSKTNNINDYNIKYIKGLSGHSDLETKNMFKNLNSKLIKFNLDNEAKGYFEVYYGNDADLRKLFLANKSKPIDPPTGDIMDCSYHLNVKTKEFQIDNIKRKIPNLVDGLVPSRRKALAGAIKKFQSNNEVKVFQLGGYVADTMLYHHGPDSLNKTIINMAQSYKGGRNFPLLIPIGNFGNTFAGPSAAGAPRYIAIKLNTKLVEALFPSIDNGILKYSYVDGERAEPEYYIPVIPTILIEDVSIPATGWKVDIYARDINKVIYNVKALINGEPIIYMNYFKNKFNIRELVSPNFNVLIGKYKIINNKTIEITELPPKVWIDRYAEKLLESKKDIIKEVITDQHSDLQTKVIIKLKTGDILEKLKANYVKKYSLDYIEYNFNIYILLSHCINVFMPDETIKSYNNYDEILRDWFAVRKQGYLDRIIRLKIILRYKIILFKNMIRFVENHEKYNISKKNDDIANKILTDNKYDMLNKSLIDSPGIITNEELETALNNNVSYSYLLNLSYSKMNDKQYEHYKELLAKAENELKLYSTKDIYKKIWLAEIDNVNNVIQDGLLNGFYSEKHRKFR